MPKIRTGKTFIDAVLMECPYCGTLVPNPTDGSLMWSLELAGPGTVGECYNCNVKVRLPANAFGRPRKEEHS